MRVPDVNRITTVIIVLIVVIVGGIVVIIHPETLSFAEYIKDVATGAGLLAIALGLDAKSRP